MLIIKPYGRTLVEANQHRSRQIALKPSLKEKQRIEDFMKSHTGQIIAQWISMIDKILRKPNNDKKASPLQAQMRKELGDAAWEYIRKKQVLACTTEERAIWDWKISPYKIGTSPQNEERLKGRWYKRFAGDAPLAKLDMQAIAEKIYQHLYESAFRIYGDKTKRTGHVKALAKSIAENNLKQPEEASVFSQKWSEETELNYAKGKNIALLIKQKVQNLEQNDSKPYPGIAIASEILFSHYTDVFKAPDGKVLRIKEAIAMHPELFALHTAIKTAYAQLFKKKQKFKEHKEKLSKILPSDMESLFRLVKNKQQNRDLNALVRLGKVIHYEASQGKDADNVANIAEQWPTADIVKASEYWTTNGQIDIKRNEAFVRVWRHVIATASRTLRDWVDPDSELKADDLLLITSDDFQAKFSPDLYRKKLSLLFGNKAELFNGNEEAQRQILWQAIGGLANLRHAAFHFKGMEPFTRQLRIAEAICDMAAIEELWKRDFDDRRAQLALTMQGSHLDYYFSFQQNQAIHQNITDSFGKGSLPLARFRKILHRVETSWNKDNDKIPFPPAPSRNKLEEQPALLCKYTALKLLYDHSFRAWLAKCNTNTLNAYIDKSIDRSTRAAKSINGPKNKNAEAQIHSRAADIGKLSENETIDDFLSRLMAETASEMRVQKGYESDAEKAREQAEYIENFKCDVLALAYHDYLKQQHFTFILELNEAAHKPEKPCEEEWANNIPIIPSTKWWQHLLYFLLHLAPADDVSSLLHQLRKWQCTGRKHKGDTQATEEIQAVFELYLDMHDAKFEGRSATNEAQDFAFLFEKKADFDVIFPIQPINASEQAENRIPKRGLREIARYGHLEPLRHVFEQHPITADHVRKYIELENKCDDTENSQIAVRQHERETLHEKLVKSGHVKDDDIKAYFKALHYVTKHRHLAAQVTLTNHVRLHRLMMAVLSRLADYAGLFERDLYFVTLALMHLNGTTPNQIFCPEPEEQSALGSFLNGQIIDALREAKKCPDTIYRNNFDKLWLEVVNYFGNIQKGKSVGVKTSTGHRNDFAHFNMLQKREPLNLTEYVNNARQMMAYDRKLKNAVSKSIIELLQREGIDLEWEMTDSQQNTHMLRNATLTSIQAKHLQKTKHPKIFPTENLHGNVFVQMVASLFGGKANLCQDVTLEGLRYDAWPLKNCKQKTGNHAKKNWMESHKPFKRKQIT